MSILKNDPEDPNAGEEAEEERRSGRVEKQPGDPTAGEQERSGHPTGGEGFQGRDDAGQFTSAGGPGNQRK